MSLQKLVEIAHRPMLDDWTSNNEDAFKSLFGGESGRYPEAARKELIWRAPKMDVGSGVSFVAYTHSPDPKSGPYSGMSSAIFPAVGRPATIIMVVGTQGLSPDEVILSRPGHRRKVRNLLLAEL